MDGFIALSLVIIACIVLLAIGIILRKPWEMNEDGPGEYWMGTGIALGTASGLAAGLAAGYALENIPVGVSLGPAMGAGIGIVLGTLLKSKYASLHRRLTPAEQNLRMWLMIASLFLLLGVILALVGLFVGRVLGVY
ncbi:MAG: hypothetical protein QMD46_08965 [Methanomicrobiales archaeon]|nr:hypothetical protein [Methanomicrobiales archaeon]MDI6875498.1 hypothetical protein [Methanomicrobiales archaeon]